MCVCVCVRAKHFSRFLCSLQFAAECLSLIAISDPFAHCLHCGQCVILKALIEYNVLQIFVECRTLLTLCVSMLKECAANNNYCAARKATSPTRPNHDDDIPNICTQCDNKHRIFLPATNHRYVAAEMKMIIAIGL